MSKVIVRIGGTIDSGMRIRSTFTHFNESFAHEEKPEKVRNFKREMN